jgi:hypothetical protein
VIALVLLMFALSILAPINGRWDMVITIERHLGAVSRVLVASIDNAFVGANALLLGQVLASNTSGAHISSACILLFFSMMEIKQ